MLKKLFIFITALAAFGQSLWADDYYFYGQWNYSGYSIDGFVDKQGKLGEPNKEYIVFINGTTGYIYRVDTEGDPNRHPDNPNSTGSVVKRTFTYISSHTISNALPGGGSFHIDESGIYYGPYGGIKRWNFDWIMKNTSRFFLDHFFPVISTL